MFNHFCGYTAFSILLTVALLVAVFFVIRNRRWIRVAGMLGLAFSAFGVVPTFSVIVKAADLNIDAQSASSSPGAVFIAIVAILCLFALEVQFVWNESRNTHEHHCYVFKQVVTRVLQDGTPHDIVAKELSITERHVDLILTSLAQCRSIKNKPTRRKLDK